MNDRTDGGGGGMSKCCDTCRYWHLTGIESSGIKMPQIAAEWVYRIGRCEFREMDSVSEWLGCVHHRKGGRR